MEYCGGGDLGRVLAKARKQNKPLAEDRVWRYFHQLLLALDHCHYPATSQTIPSTSGGASSSDPPVRRTQQVLHRDIKPENVFVTNDDNLKLGDFGLSKMMGPSTLTNTYVGVSHQNDFTSDMALRADHVPAIDALLHVPRDVDGKVLRYEVRHLESWMFDLRVMCPPVSLVALFARCTT